jgi:L-alanine-DL-glutamate epimerase-like enolase superfamily enzyme
MKIVKVSAIPMSAPVPQEKRHRTDLGTKVKSDATLIRVETDNGLTGIGAALGTPPIVAAIVEHELAAGQGYTPARTRARGMTKLLFSSLLDVTNGGVFWIVALGPAK